MPKHPDNTIRDFIPSGDELSTVEQQRFHSAARGPHESFVKDFIPSGDEETAIFLDYKEMANFSLDAATRAGIRENETAGDRAAEILEALTVPETVVYIKQLSTDVERDTFLVAERNGKNRKSVFTELGLNPDHYKEKPMPTQFTPSPSDEAFKASRGVADAAEPEATEPEDTATEAPESEATEPAAEEATEGGE